MVRIRLIAPLTLALLATACASSGQPGTTRPPSSGRNVLTRQDLDGVVEDNAFDVIQRLRPSWLRRRGRAQLPAVFRDDLRVGTSIEALRSMRLENVLELRYVSASDATTKWGTGYTGGVIQIVSRR